MTLDAPIKDDIAFAMEEISRGLRRTFDNRMQSAGLSRTKWRLLVHLQRNNGINQTELARLLELERASVGQAIDDLEKLDLVKREPSPNDRRVWLIRLRPEARIVLKRLRREADDVYATMWSGFASADLVLLQSQLRRLAMQLAAVDREYDIWGDKGISRAS